MNCAAELCPYWPGEGCVRAFAPCGEPVRDSDRVVLIPDEDVIVVKGTAKNGLDTWDF